MSIVIPQELESFVQQELESGRYRSEAEIVCKGLGLLQEREKKLAELRRELQIGLDDIARGDVIHIRNEAELKAFFDDICERGIQRLEAKKNETNS